MGTGSLHSPFDVIVVASSRGGVRALPQLLKSLPEDFPVPVIVVQHRMPGPDLLPEVLGRRTRLSVTAAHEGQDLDAGVHVLPARRVFAVDEDRRLRDRGERMSGQADGVLSGLAHGSGLNVCAVVLTGDGIDGAVGVRAVKRARGWVLVQDPATAMAREMPTAALATGCADLVLPLPVLGAALVVLAMLPGAAPMFRRPAAPWANLTAG